MRKLLAWLIYKFPRISSGLTSTGGAGGGVALAKPLAGVSVAATGRSAGATIFLADTAGTSGFTAELARIAEVFSRLTTAGSTVFSLTVTSVPVSTPPSTVVAVSVCGFVAGLAGAVCLRVAAASFLAAALLSSLESTAPIVDGTMSAILSFSTNTYPKGVRTLNMLSSYATMTP